MYSYNVPDDKYYYDYAFVEEIHEETPKQDDTFFIETSESKGRIDVLLRRERIKTAEENEVKRRKIEFMKEYYSNIRGKMEMSSEELREKIEEQMKIRNDIKHSRSLKQKVLKLENDLKRQNEFTKQTIEKLKSDENGRENEISSKKEKISEMERTLSNLKAEKKTWKSIGEDVNEDLWNLISEQKKKNFMMEQKIQQYSRDIQHKLSKVTREFNNLQIYISNQLSIEEAAAEEVQYQKAVQEQEESNRRFEDLKREEAKCRPRPNARKNDLFYNFHLFIEDF